MINRATSPRELVPGEPSLGRRTRAIVDEMGVAIITGSFRPGELLPVEAELCQRFSSSRSVLREAIKVLNAKGLLTARPRLGTSVTDPSDWNLFDPDVLRWTLKRNFSLPLLIEFTQIRLGIEPLAASLAAQSAPDDQKAAIAVGFERMVAARNGQDDPLESDVAFHVAIMDASGNRFFRRLKPLIQTALHISILYTDDIARDEDSKIEVHRAVLDAIQAGDASRAAEANRQLLQEALDLMIAGMNSEAAA